MPDVYKRLARRLDELHGSFPSTESGVEIRILKKVYTPADAEMAFKLGPVPETAEALAERLGIPLPRMQSILDDMVAKGQIGSVKQSGRQLYALPALKPALQLKSIDRELAELWEEYYPAFLQALGAHQPAGARVVPVGVTLDASVRIHRYEDVRAMLEGARSFQVQDCICRKKQALEGRPCGHTLNNCLIFSMEEDAYKAYPRGRDVSREEALAMLAAGAEEGLVHCSYNVAEGPFQFICNCCTCSCLFLRGIKEFHAPYMLAKSNFVAAINAESCSACGTCANERCPMEAITSKDGDYRVNGERCIGCGVCTPTCPTESIRLERRPASQQLRPPANSSEWNAQRAASRATEIDKK